MRTRWPTVVFALALCGAAAGVVVVVALPILHGAYPDHGTRTIFEATETLIIGLLLASLVSRRDRSAGVALSEERRRLARDLHDGLAQELAFIATQAKRMAGYRGSDKLVAAAERALDEARRAIAALTFGPDETLDCVLARTAEDAAGRTGTALHLDLSAGVQVAPATREALVRIVREAVNNAARHGHPDAVSVTMANGNGVMVRVSDDGNGFDLARPGTGEGFGLVSMRERAAALGGELRMQSTVGVGTQVEVWVP